MHGRPEESFHEQLLYRLIVGSPGTTTEDLQVLYEAVAPVAYHGRMDQPIETRRWRRQILEGLVDDGVVDHHDTPRGRIWYPVVIPDELEIEVGVPSGSNGESATGDV